MNLVIFQSHWKHAEQIIKTFENELPLKHFFKKYFVTYKECGSRDRKIITNIVYAFYRLAVPNTEYNIQEVVQQSFYLQENYLSADINITFSFEDLISPLIIPQEYKKSFFAPPFFFIKILRNKKNILSQLSIHNIEYTILPDDVLLFKSGKINIASILEECDYYIQDYACQQIIKQVNLKGTETIWDCCSGSGGKSILLKHAYPNLALTNSDERKSIICNLKKRFRLYDIISIDIFNLDVSVPIKKTLLQFDIILADVPCTGSGTWHSNPENIFFFNVNELQKCTSLQQNIVKNILPFLKNDGLLIYITCSIFKSENEEQIQYFITQYSLQLISQQYIHLNEYNTDYIFLCVMRKIK